MRRHLLSARWRAIYDRCVSLRDLLETGDSLAIYEECQSADNSSFF